MHIDRDRRPRHHPPIPHSWPVGARGVGPSDARLAMCVEEVTEILPPDGKMSQRGMESCRLHQTRVTTCVFFLVPGFISIGVRCGHVCKWRVCLVCVSGGCVVMNVCVSGGCMCEWRICSCRVCTPTLSPTTVHPHPLTHLRPDRYVARGQREETDKRGCRHICQFVSG